MSDGKNFINQANVSSRDKKMSHFLVNLINEKFFFPCCCRCWMLMMKRAKDSRYKEKCCKKMR